MEQHVGGSYRTVCQFITMNCMLFHSTRSFELYIHLLDIRSGNFMNWDISQIRFDSILNDGSIISDCTGAKVHGHDLIQPFIQPFTQGVILSVGKLHFSICFDQAMEFLQHFLLRFVYYGSVDRFALQIPTDHNAAFPAAIFSFSYQSVTGRSSLCHMNRLLSYTNTYHKAF